MGELPSQQPPGSWKWFVVGAPGDNRESRPALVVQSDLFAELLL